MDEKQIDHLLEDLGENYHSPPPVPRDRIWARIAAQRVRRPGGRLAALRLGWVAATALALLLGLLMGSQLIARRAPERGGDQRTLEFAAAPLFGRAETFLAYARQAPAGDQQTSRTSEWARELLAETRMLLDAPIGRDTQLAQLLEDLELVLVQIVRCGRGADIDCDRVGESIDRRALMTRLGQAGERGAPRVHEL